MVRSSHRLAGLAVALVAGACGDSLDISVDYRIVGLTPATAGACGAAPTAPPIATGATRVRFTFRDHTAAGPGPLRCDVVLPRSGASRPVLAVPRKSEPVDLWVEYFTDDGVLVARGERRGVDLGGGAVTIYASASDGYACEPAQPTMARAFHSATLLPTGEVLLLGGLTGRPGGGELSPADGAYVTASAEIYDPATARVFPIAITGFTARAFHHVVVLGTATNGDVVMAVSGGLGVAGDPGAQGNVAAIAGPAGEAPWRAVAPDTALGRGGSLTVGAELLVYAPSARTVSRMPIVGAMGLPFASGGVDDVSLPTPRAIGGGEGTGGDGLDLLEPEGTVDIRLTGVPRVGATVVAATASTALWIGGDLTGARYYDRLIQLDAAPSIEAGPPPTGDHNRAFASAVRLDDEIVVAGGLRITTGAITDVTGAIPGARIDLATGAATDLPLADFTPAAYLATAQLPRGGALISGGVIAGDATCAGTLACVIEQSMRYAADLTASATGAPGLARAGHQLTRLDSGVVLVSGGFTRGAAAGTVRPVATLERFEPHLAADDPLADVGPVRLPGEVAQLDGVAIAPCQIVQGGPSADAAVDAGTVDAVEIDALEIDAP